METSPTESSDTGSPHQTLRYDDSGSTHGSMSADFHDSVQQSPLNSLRISSTPAGMVAHEFLRSEESYRAALDILWSAYMQPMFNRHDNGVAMMEQYGADLYAVIACHTMISNQLVDLSSATDFCTVLISMAPSLQNSYTKYVLNFSRNSIELEHCRKGIPDDVWESGMVAIALNMKDANPLLRDVDVSFNSLVAMPMQRLVRYGLLCENMVKSLPDEVDGANGGAADSREEVAEDPAARRKEAIDAGERIQQLCAAVNESKEMMVNTRKLLDIERDFGLRDLSLDPFKKLLNEGDFTRAKHSRPTDGKSVKLQDVHVFLMNDELILVVYLNEERTRIKRIERLPLRDVESVRNMQSDQSLRFGKGQHGLLLVHRGVIQSSQGSVLRRKSTAVTTVPADESSELVLLDTDPLNVGIWVKDISFAVNKLYVE